MHQASVGGSCFAADAMKAHAPSYSQMGDANLKSRKSRTLSDPNIWMV